MVRLASTGALVKVTGGEVTMLNQNRVRMKLELLERQQYNPALEMVAVEDWGNRLTMMIAMLCPPVRQI